MIIVLPLKAAWRDAIANVKCFSGARGTIELISMVSFTFIKRRHPVHLASASFTSFRLIKFGCAPFAVCNAWQRSRTQNLPRVGENSGPILTRLWTKVHDIFT